MTNNCHFLWNSSSKIQFFTDFSTFSAGGCWGQPMLLFWRLGQETQMSTPPEATRHRILTQLLVLLHLRAIYFGTFQYETPCSSFNLSKLYLECKKPILRINSSTTKHGKKIRCSEMNHLFKSIGKIPTCPSSLKRTVLIQSDFLLVYCCLWKTENSLLT